MQFIQDFFSKIENKTALIGIVGLGYVGIPLAMRFSEVGFKVLGFDINEQRVNDLNSGESPIAHLPNERLGKMKDSGFEATTDFSRIADVDTIIICVPTPLNKYREPDMSFVVGTLESVSPFFRPGQMIALESTTYPGTTREMVVPFVEKAGLKPGEEMFVVYSPEREDPGNKDFETRTIPKVVGGLTDKCLEVGSAVYQSIIDNIVPVQSVEVAELTKLLENIHRAVNIGLVNEMKIIADRMGINIFDVIDAAATKPFGFTPYYPGPGLGGHCIPIDPFYLTWKAREFGINTRFIELAGDINRKMPEWVAGKVGLALNAKQKSVNGSKILALGIAYKRDVDDMRESPSVFVMEELRNLGAEISYHDPWVPAFPQMREHDFDLSSIELSEEIIKSYDCIVVLTDHSNVDYEFIRKHAQLIVDTRNVYGTAFENVVPA